MENSPSITSPTLLSRLRTQQRDEAAWREFVERYGPRIYEWCVIRGLQASDAEDVAQNVLLKMATYLKGFEYDSTLSFRAWLRRVTENAIRDFFREQSRKAQAENGSEILRLLDAVEAREDLAERLSAAFDLELMDEAMARVSSRIAPNRWLAWRLTAQDGRSAPEVASELNMKVASVYTARNQVQKMIREELQLLERPEAAS